MSRVVASEVGRFFWPKADVEPPVETNWILEKEMDEASEAHLYKPKSKGQSQRWEASCRTGQIFPHVTVIEG